MSQKKKIVILGAGPGGLSAAFGLTATQELRDRYDVTIYQVGWRAGGKCSSGRAGPTNRIEQNGTHYLFGCYDNCFDTVKKAYDELEAEGIDWFGKYDEAFLPRDLLAFKEFFRGKWELWPIDLPTNPTEPGTRDGFLRPIQYVSMTLQFMVEFVAGRRVLQWLRPRGPFEPKPSFLRRAIYMLLRPFWLVFAYLVVGLSFAFGKTMLIVLRTLGDEGLESIVWLLKVWRKVTRASLGRLSYRYLAARRVFVAVDFETALLIGVIRDRVYGPDRFGAIEHLEFREWLRGHGASETTLYAPFITTWYDAVAAYEDGDPQRPNLSAGVSVMSLLKALLMYKGHFAYQMRAEIADSFIAPIFQCLRERGVKMRFFHRVWDVVPGAGAEIDAITVERQVDLRSGDPDSYQPFIEVQGLHAWPGRPLWDQIVQAEPLPYPSECEERLDYDMESFYTTWRGEKAEPPVKGAMHTLKKGVDFDTVILAMPTPTFPTYCKKLMLEKPAWKTMVDELPAVETQSIRLWFKPSLAELGWPLAPPILSAYAKPFSTWEDNGHLVDVETWPEDHRPKAMATVFGAQPSTRVAPSYDHETYPCDQLKKARANAFHFMNHEIGPLWPGGGSPPRPLGVDWTKLIDLDDGEGAERFDSQYVRSNAGPIERYVMARADTVQYRLAADESGYKNLVLAGDWTSNHFLIGSVEGAMMGGFQASRAICGFPAKIPGEGTGL